MLRATVTHMYAQELDIRYTPHWILAPHDIDLFGWQDYAYLAYYYYIQ